MNQDETVRQAKEGQPQAIAALINKSLSAKGMAVKAKSNNECLVVQVEAQTPPPQQSVVNFVKTGLLNLKPNNISQVIVQGRVTGQTKVTWQESFSLVASEPKPLTNQPKVEGSKPPATVRQTSISRISINTSQSSSSVVERVTEFVKTRNGERVAIVLGTALLTSISWMSLGTLGTRFNVATTRSTGAVSSTALAASNSGPFSIKGTFQLIDSDIGGIPSHCYGTGGFDDVEAGMPVTIRDGNGSILATGEVGAGTQPSGEPFANVTCIFQFQVDNVPKADFYAIEVGRRGELNFSFAEMQQKNWTVQLSLGT